MRGFASCPSMQAGMGHLSWAFGGADNCILPGTVATVLNVWDPEGDIIMALNGMTSEMEIDFFRVFERDEIAELRLCGKYSIPEYGCSFAFGL
jgi:hypothetical protein